MDKKRILDFATEYLALYESSATSSYQVEEGFDEKCLAFGFKIDSAEAFLEVYPETHPFDNVENLKSIIEHMDDVDLLGGVIFSMWRRITHWDCCGDLLSKENRLWFVVAFSRLKELAEKIGSENCTIILFPEFVTLKSEVENLRTEMSMLLLERDELLFVECKNIEMTYMMVLGNLEYKAYELHCVVLRLKRKIELIQAKENRLEKVILSEIEQTLDDEFAKYKAQLDEQINRMNSALKRSKSKLLSEEESKEIKKIYHSVVKSLHPDIHPDITEAQVVLFRNAVSAYENGDLDSLRIIGAMVSEPVLLDNKENGMTLLAKEKERLTNLLQIIKDKITEIKHEYPYTMKSLVKDEEKIEEKKVELEDTISQLKEVLELYKAKIKEMLR